MALICINGCKECNGCMNCAGEPDLIVEYNDMEEDDEDEE